MDLDAFGEGMNLLSAVFDPDTISEDKVGQRFQAYLLVLADQMDGEDFKAACLWATRNLKFFPRPAELLNHHQLEREADLRQRMLAASERQREQRRLRGEYYAALADCPSDPPPAGATEEQVAVYQAKLARLRAAFAADLGVDPDSLDPDPRLLNDSCWGAAKERYGAAADLMHPELVEGHPERAAEMERMQDAVGRANERFDAGDEAGGHAVLREAGMGVVGEDAPPPAPTISAAVVDLSARLAMRRGRATG